MRNTKGRLFKRNLLKLDRGLVNLWSLKISSLAGHFKKTNAFLVYDICFMKLFTINGVYIKVFSKLIMA